MLLQGSSTSRIQEGVECNKDPLRMDVPRIQEYTRGSKIMMNTGRSIVAFEFKKLARVANCLRATADVNRNN